MKKTGMKKRLLATIGLLTLGMASAASAADLPARTYSKAPAAIATVYDWSGFYIGANGGYGWSRDCRRNLNIPLDLGCSDATGGVAGGQIGYRWQSGGWVFGLEAQGDWADLKGSTVNLNPVVEPGSRLGSRMDAFGLFTGQVGYAWNNALLYVKGGAAVTDRRFDFNFSPSGAVTNFSTGFSTRWGGTVGAGVEYGFAPNWSAALEYDHIFEDKHNVVFTNAPGTVLGGSRRSGGDTDLITARVNYRWGGPVVAKY